MTQPCHKNTTPTQQCCDSKHTEGRDDAKENKTTREEENGTTQSARPNPNTRTPQHRDTTNTPPRHSTRPPNQQDGDADTKRGDTSTQTGGVGITPRLSVVMPPHLVMPPHHPQWPPPPPRQGGRRRRIPHHTKEYRHTHTHTHHTLAREQYATRQQYTLGMHWE